MLMEYKNLKIVFFVIICLFLFSACQSANDSSPSSNPEENADGGSVTGNNSGDTSTKSEPSSEEEINAAWQASPHADTYLLDAEGKNNQCAQCHAPVNWQPSMDDIPESCMTCKFELEDPPSVIPETEWVSIPCKVCHKEDKKGVIAPEYSWLEIAAIDEYAAVESTTELCRKCHTPEPFAGHTAVVLDGVHSEFTCTTCHDPHDTMASCGGAACHEDVFSASLGIPGHDEQHALVTCAACHDASGMDVGYLEEEGIFTTLITITAEESESVVPSTSHNIQLESSCDKCHFTANPWGLLEEVSTP